MDGGIIHTHRFSPAQDREPVGDLLDLVEFMGDEYDGIPLLLQVDEFAEKLRRFLRGQNRGRLVEDEDLRTPDQRL